MAKVTRPSPPGVSPARAYPHVNEIKDPSTQNSLRLLWDRVFSVLDQMEAQRASLAAHDETLSTLRNDLNQATETANSAAAAAGKRTSNAPSGDEVGGSAGEFSDDKGQGELGCATSGVNGHVNPNTPKTRETMGKICCGVGKEFPSLLVPVANDTLRQAQRNELLQRMIWHLNLAGFQAQQYPSFPQSQFVLLIDSPTEGVAYRVISYNEYPEAITTVMVFAGGSKEAGVKNPSGGIAD